MLMTSLAVVLGDPEPGSTAAAQAFGPCMMVSTYVRVSATNILTIRPHILST
jgi:hypothetical protein